MEILLNVHSAAILLLTLTAIVAHAQSTITRNGEPVAYLGALVKRKAFSAGDFMRIAAGGSLDSKVELSALYDLSAAGVHNIQYDVQSVQTLRGPALDAATPRPCAATSARSATLRPPSP